MRFLAGFAVVLWGLTGCGGSLDDPSYPEDLRYPLRKDLLVTKAPDKDVRTLPGPGRLDEGIAAAGAETVDPTKLSREQQKELHKALDDVFGKPAKPRVDLEAIGAGGAEIDALELDSRTLRRGSRNFRRHCLHCHGLTGDGRGPTGPWVNPHPRDYRQGTFKFISTDPDLNFRKPRRADLVRTLTRGIDGTTMPSFGILPEQELRELVSYVMHLSIRGEVEYFTVQPLAKGEDLKDSDGKTLSVGEFVAYKARDIVGQWAESNSKPPFTPPAYPYPEDDKKALADSIRRGHQLFLTQEAACTTCHYDYGRQSAYKYDNWGTLVRPANLTIPVYRGGRRPIDHYWRIAGSIPGTPMPKLPTELRVKAWDLVNFVQALPYPAMLPDDVRNKVYGSPESRGPERAVASSR